MYNKNTKKNNIKSCLKKRIKPYRSKVIERRKMLHLMRLILSCLHVEHVDNSADILDGR